MRGSFAALCYILVQIYTFIPPCRAVTKISSCRAYEISNWVPNSLGGGGGGGGGRRVRSEVLKCRGPEILFPAFSKRHTLHKKQSLPRVN